MGVKLLGKKIHEIAKEVGLTSKEVLKIANDLGIDVKSHLSAVEEKDANRIKENITGKKDMQKKESGNQNAKPAKKDTTSSNAKKNETPVIIRREVIISEEEEKKAQDEAKAQERSKKDVGFVERRNKNDYNIVYRNKQTKPLTVSELFGLKPKEEPKKEVVEEKKEPVKEQKEEVADVFKNVKNCKILDYIAIWFNLASEFINGSKSKFAFVSTNSICQGEQIAVLWPLILSRNEEITFAYTSFKWSNNASTTQV